MSKISLDEFNELGAYLRITLDKKPRQMNGLYNLEAPAKAKIKSLELSPDFLYTEDHESTIVLEKSSISIGNGKKIVKIDAPNGEHFTIPDLFEAIEKSEKELRPDTEWFGGIDIHHVFFEGIYLIDKDNEVYRTQWGS